MCHGPSKAGQQKVRHSQLPGVAFKTEWFQDLSSGHVYHFGVPRVIMGKTPPFVFFSDKGGYRLVPQVLGGIMN